MLVEVGVDADGGGVQPGLVREGGVADIGLPGVRRLVGDVGDRERHMAQRGQLLVADQRPAVLELQVRDDRGEVGVAGALAVAVHRPLHLADARLDRGDRVRDRATGVVVAVDAQFDAHLGGGRDDVGHLAGQHPAVGVTQHDDLGAGVRGGADDREGIVSVGSVAVEEVLAVDEDVLAQPDQVGDGVVHHRQVLLQRGAQCVGDVPVVTLGDDADVLGAGIDQRLGQGIGGSAAASLAGRAEGDQTGIAELQLGLRGLEEGGVVGVRARPATLDEGDAQTVQQPCDAQLVGHRQPQALLLGPVAQGGVEDLEVLGGQRLGGHGGTTPPIRVGPRQCARSHGPRPLVPARGRIAQSPVSRPCGSTRGCPRPARTGCRAARRGS